MDFLIFIDSDLQSEEYTTLITCGINENTKYTVKENYPYAFSYWDFLKWDALWILLSRKKQKQNKTSSCVSSFPISSPIEFINTIIDLDTRISQVFHFHSSLSPFPFSTPVCTTESLIVTITLTSQLASPL